MNIIISYNNAHEVFFKNYFKPSLREDHTLHINKIDHDEELHISIFNNKKWEHNKIFNYYESERAKFILNLLCKNPDKIFFYLDVDIQFIRPISKDLMCQLRSKDMLFLKGGSQGINLGGVLIKSNQKTIDFFSEFYDLHIKDNHLTGNQKLLKDSKILNSHPQDPSISNRFNLKWDYLPENKYACGHVVSYSSKFRIWKNIPPEILLHHANGTTGINNKIAQLEYVKNNFDKIKSLNYRTKRLYDKLYFFFNKKKLLYNKYIN